MILHKNGWMWRMINGGRKEPIPKTVPHDQPLTPNRRRPFDDATKRLPAPAGTVLYLSNTTQNKL